MQYSLAEPFENEVPTIISAIAKMHLWLKKRTDTSILSHDVIFSSYILGIP